MNDNIEEKTRDYNKMIQRRILSRTYQVRCHNCLDFVDPEISNIQGDKARLNCPTCHNTIKWVSKDGALRILKGRESMKEENKTLTDEEIDKQKAEEAKFLEEVGNI